MQICLGRTTHLFDNDNIGILATASSRCLVSGTATELEDGRVEIKEMSSLYLKLGI
jgi:hypothetical protein